MSTSDHLITSHLRTDQPILVADAGSTKISWSLVFAHPSEDINFETKGMNPVYLDDAALQFRFKSEILSQLEGHIPQSIRFFGAGVFGKNIKRMQSLFRWYFKSSDIYCGSDLQGAALALFGQESGVGCILGTGSNSCLVRHGRIQDQIPTLGFVLGDEGSAGWLGKQLLKHHYYRTLPEDLKNSFSAIAPQREELLRIIREDAYFNRYIASYASFIAENVNHPFLNAIVRKGFRLFIDYHIAPYGKEQIEGLTLGFLGTVAHEHQPILVECVQEAGFEIGPILKMPIEAIKSFYRTSLTQDTTL